MRFKNLFVLTMIVWFCQSLFGCGSGDDSNNHPETTRSEASEIRVRITSNVQAGLTDKSIINVTLFGLDANRKHISPISVVDHNWSVGDSGNFPTEALIQLEENPTEYVCRGDDTCDDMYYLRALVDLDGDGMVCPGDLVPDPSLTQFTTYSLDELTSQNNELYVSLKEGDASDCVAPSQYYDELEGEYTIPITLTLEDDNQFEAGASGVVILYGFDDDLTDKVVVPIVSAPFDPAQATLEVDIPLLEDPGPYVCDENYPCADRYGLFASIDVDGDGQICPGDLVQYNDDPFLESYTLDELRTLGANLHMLEKTGAPSDCFNLTDTAFQ